MLQNKIHFCNSSCRGFIQPTLLNTDSSEIDLEDIQFPLHIKICAEPGFNETAIEEVGYENSPWRYFYGISRFNSSIVGWAGHTQDFGDRGGVEEVFKKVRNHIVEEVISSIWIDFKTEPPLNISSESVTNLVSLKRVNYPHNCYTLDLSSVAELRHESMKTIFISFKSGNIEKVQISLKGRTLASNREIYDNTFHTKGDTISTTPGRLKNRLSWGRRREKVQELPKFRVCELHGMWRQIYEKRLCKDSAGPDLAFRWYWPSYHKSSDKSIRFTILQNQSFAFNASDVERCLSQFDGYDTSPCRQPCTTFQTQTRFVSGLNMGASHFTQTDPMEMMVRIKFSPKVIIFQFKEVFCFAVSCIVWMRWHCSNLERLSENEKVLCSWTSFGVLRVLIEDVPELNTVSVRSIKAPRSKSPVQHL